MIMKNSIGPKPLLLPSPVLIVGSYDPSGKPNAMNAAWGGIANSNPPCVAISLRKATYTHGNIMNRKAFTISIPSEKYVKEADYFGMKSGKDTDKFEGARLTPVRSEKVDAPYVGEFPVVLECTLLHYLELGSHTHFIGEIVDIKVDEECLNEAGLPDIAKALPFCFDLSSRSYYGIGKKLDIAFDPSVLQTFAKESR